MNNLSNERLLWRLQRFESTVAEARSMEDEEFARECEDVACVIRELLALREAGKEPVGFRWRHASHNYDQDWSYVNHRATPDAFESEQVIQYLYAAPQLPTVPEYPELLPCPVLLEPGFRFGKGVPTSSMLGALKRRAEHQAELDAMSPEAKAEYDASIEKLKAVLMPDGAEQRLAAAVDLLKQSAPHMLSDESMKDPDGALCGKRRAVPDGEMLRRWVAFGRAMEKSGSTLPRHLIAETEAMIAAAPKPE